MKKKLFFSALLGFLGVLPLSAGETVGAISFNPSRLGKYTYLKVQSGADFNQGLNVQTLTFKGNKEITLGGSGANQKVNMMINTVSGLASGTRINMPNMTFRGFNDNSEQTLNVEMKGGDMNMSSGQIKEIDAAAGALKVEATSRLDSTVIAVNNSFKLGDVTIAQPAKCYQKYKWQKVYGPNNSYITALAVDGERVCPGEQQYQTVCSWEGVGETCYIRYIDPGQLEYACWVPQNYSTLGTNVFSENPSMTQVYNLQSTRINFSGMAYSADPIEQEILSWYSGSKGESFCDAQYVSKAYPVSLNKNDKVVGCTSEEDDPSSSSKAKDGNSGYVFEQVSGGLSPLSCYLYQCKCRKVPI